MRARPAALLGARVLGLGGCSSTGAPGPQRAAPEPPPTGTGYFVGTGPQGVGASLDLFGDDPVSRAIEAALRERDPGATTESSVGIASIVNEGTLGIAAPRFVAELAGGGAIPLRSAAGVIRAVDGPAGRRALGRLGAVPSRVPAGGSATTYVVLEGAAPAAVESVRMVVVGGSPVALAARRR
jgi:hypothetical protein